MAQSKSLNIAPSELDKIIAQTGINRDAYLATLSNESEVKITFDGSKPLSTPAEIKATNLANVRYEGHRLFQGSTEKSQIPGYSTRFGYLNQKFKAQGISPAQQTKIVNELRSKYPLAFSTNMSTADILKGTKPSTADIQNKEFHGKKAFDQGIAMVAELKSKYGIDLGEQVIYANTSTGIAQVLGDEIKGTGANGTITLNDMKTNFANETGDKLNTQSIINYFNTPAAKQAYANKPSTVIIPISNTKGIEVNLSYDARAVGEFHNGREQANIRRLSSDTINVTNGTTKKTYPANAGIKLNYIERLALNTVNEATRQGKPTTFREVNLPANYLRSDQAKPKTPKR
jgi:hypothetical protein